MISLFIQSVYSKTVTGKYSESKLWDTLKENLLIVDCVFANLGEWSAYAPVWIDGGLGNKIELNTQLIYMCCHLFISNFDAHLMLTITYL